jgi:hypothetical protein
VAENAVSEIVCRECGSDDHVVVFDIIREDGEYPDTPLCDECIGVYAVDSDVISMHPAGRKSLELDSDEAEWLARLIAYNLWRANGDKEIGDPIFTQLVTTFGIDGELEDLSRGT